MAHLLRSKSVPIHFVMCIIDYSAVGFSFCGLGIMLYYSLGNALFYDVFGNAFPVLNYICNLNLTICATLGITLYKHDPRQRRRLHNISCVVMAMILLIPLLCRLYSCIQQNNCLPVNNTYALCLFTVGSFFFVSKLPERSCSGMFDICGHSHQIFHKAGPIGCILAIKACHFDLVTLPGHILAMAKPNIIAMWGGLWVFLVVNILAVTVILCKVRHIISNEKFWHRCTGSDLSRKLKFAA